MPDTNQTADRAAAHRRGLGRRLVDLAGFAAAILITALLVGAVVYQLIDRARASAIASLNSRIT